MHPLQRRLFAEDFVRLRRADEQRRYAASQRRGRIDANPHQIDAVVFALRRIPDGGCILADEVGLGKTIEAGLVIAQLLAEGMRRILLIVPKSLLGQWQTELYSLFGIEAREGRADPESLAGDGVFLVHREFAGGPRGSSLLRAADPFELVVIDEAHEVFANIYKRFDRNGEYDPHSSEAQTADRVRSILKPAGTPVLLLTATPIQNSLAELWGLVQYVEHTGLLLGRLPTFREVFCVDKDRTLAQGQAFELRRRLGNVLQRTLRRQAQDFLEVPFVERQARLIEYSMTPEEQKLYDDVTAWLMDPYGCSFGGRNRRLLLIGFHRRMASSLAALSSSLEKVATRLRKELSGRRDHSWDELAIEFARDLEEDMEDREESTDEDMAEPPSQDRVQAEISRIEGFIRSAKEIPRDSKAHGLLEALRVIRDRASKGEGSGKAVIFTESLQTQEFLYSLLTSNGYLLDEVTLFRGQNDSPRATEALNLWEEEVGRAISMGNRPSREVAIRLALVHEFRERSKVFISTEAGAKGLNLQFCEVLINYDLPWNPQRIEQRIGRVHRYGQRRGVTVLSFLDRGNEAQRLTFEILSQKLDLFGKVLDASDVVLHAPSSDFPEPIISGLGVEFERQLRRIYEQSRSLDEITEQLRALREAMDVKRSEFDTEQARAAELIETRFDESVRQVFQRYREELPAGLKQLDRDLDTITSAYLRAVNVEFERSESPTRITYRVLSSPHLPDRYQDGGTFLIGHARDLNEGGLLHSGHPLVTAALDEARQATSRPLEVELGPGESRLPESLKHHAGRRGYLVVTRVSYRGMESVDHLLVTALIEQQDTPFDCLTVDSLLGLSVRDLPPSEARSTINQTELDDAVEECVLRDQAATTIEDETRFNRKLEQLDRYLEDQIFVLKRARANRERKLLEAERKKQSATLPSTLTREDRSIYRLQGEMRTIEERIERLQQGADPDYQRWRDRLYERRYQRPSVERILEVSFRITGDGTAC
jgi:adenine-specific DNA-methyltransferase